MTRIYQRWHNPQMEPVKALEQFLEADPRMSGFVLRPIGTSEWRNMSINDHYGDLDGLDLSPNVPEAVVSYVNVIKNLYLYGWLCYPFFTVCQMMTGMAVEMALRLRMPNPTGKRDKRMLHELLRSAIDQGLLRDDGFPSLPEKQAEAKQWDEAFEKATGSKVTNQRMPYVEVLADCLPKLRNEFAHPHAAWIVTPGMALEPIRIAVEIANQLWP